MPPSLFAELAGQLCADVADYRLAVILAPLESDPDAILRPSSSGLYTFELPNPFPTGGQLIGSCYYGSNTIAFQNLVISKKS